MRTVTLVESLVVKEVRLAHGEQIRRFHIGGHHVRPLGDDCALVLDEPVCAEIIPAHEFHRRWTNGRKSDMYIAVSKDVQELLQIPMDALAERCEAAETGKQQALAELAVDRAKIKNAEHAGFLRRLAYLLTGDFDRIGSPS